MKYNYYGVRGDYVWHLAWDNSWLLHKNINSQHVPKLMRESDQVWMQGPRGGVRLIKHAYWDYWATYVRRDSVKMKQFLWVKLRAKKLGS